MASDPAVLSIFNSLLVSSAEEMGAALGRSALSPNIRERRDYSCAVFDRRGRLNEEAYALILRNVRTPAERRGDLAAQAAAQRTGVGRLVELAERYGLAALEEHFGELLDYAARLTVAAIERIPPGTYRFEDALDDDGVSAGAVRIRVAMRSEGGRLVVDFKGSAPERPGSVNAVAAVTRSAVYYAVMCLLGGNAPLNAGCFRPIEILLPQASVVSA